MTDPNGCASMLAPCETTAAAPYTSTFCASATSSGSFGGQALAAAVPGFATAVSTTSNSSVQGPEKHFKVTAAAPEDVLRSLRFWTAEKPEKDPKEAGTDADGSGGSVGGGSSSS